MERRALMPDMSKSGIHFDEPHKTIFWKQYFNAGASQIIWTTWTHKKVSFSHPTQIISLISRLQHFLACKFCI